jgi:hypothetical protein
MADIDKWLAGLSLKDADQAIVKTLLGDFVEDMADFKGLTKEDIQELCASIDLAPGMVKAKKNKAKTAVRLAWGPTGGGGAGGGGTPSSPMLTQFPKGIALVMHITYSREDSELVMKVQDAARKAKWEISGIMSNQGKEWFEAWKIALNKSHGVCVFFTEGNAMVLNNQGVGYTDKFATRMKSLGDEAPLYIEAMAILAVKAERPDFKIYVVDGIEFLPEQLAFNLMDDAPSFGPVDKWTAYVEGGWREQEARKEAEEQQVRKDAEGHARKEAAGHARKEPEEKTKKEAEEKAKMEAEEKVKMEAEEKVKMEAEEKARMEAEEKAKMEAEEKAKMEAEEKAKMEAEEKTKKEAEEKTKKEAEEKAKKEAE